MIELPAPLTARFQATRLLGSGAFGRVVLARDRELDRQVALKLMVLPENPAWRARAEREAESMSRVTHPNLVRLLDRGFLGNVAWLVTEYLDGPALHEAPVEGFELAWMLEIGGALDALHDAGLLHRDMKPQNIVLAGGSRPVLVDLGLALDPEAHSRLTSTGQLVGTPGFMAPEMVRHMVYSRASDWFAWGVTLYWLHERRLPFAVGEMLAAAGEGKLPPLGFRRIDAESPLARLLRSCLDPEPQARPHSSAEASATLASTAGGPRWAGTAPSGMPGRIAPDPRERKPSEPGAVAPSSPAAAVAHGPAASAGAPPRRPAWATLACGILLGAGLSRATRDTLPRDPSPAGAITAPAPSAAAPVSPHPPNPPPSRFRSRSWIPFATSSSTTGWSSRIGYGIRPRPHSRGWPWPGT